MPLILVFTRVDRTVMLMLISKFQLWCVGVGVFSQAFIVFGVFVLGVRDV